MRERIERQLAVLVGEPLQYIGRASLMVWVGFGPMVRVRRPLGDEDEQARYALHIQCPMRVVGPEGIITGSTDLFHARDEPYRELEEGEWDTKVDGKLPSTLFDARIEQFFASHQPSDLVVDGITADAVGSVRIVLRGGFALEIFPDTSLPSEYWRFFQADSDDRHFVVTGAGIED
jgi:hypothetical protein